MRRLCLLLTAVLFFIPDVQAADDVEANACLMVSPQHVVEVTSENVGVVQVWEANPEIHKNFHDLKHFVDHIAKFNDLENFRNLPVGYQIEYPYQCAPSIFRSQISESDNAA